MCGSSWLSMCECGDAGCYPPLVLHRSESGPLGLSVCECRVAGSASGQTACPVCPTLRQSRSPVLVPPWQLESSTTRLPVSTPPTGLDECLFFYLLGVGLPCRLIFCQFWLCEEAQCVYLRLHLGSPRHFILIDKIFFFSQWIRVC